MSLCEICVIAKGEQNSIDAGGFLLAKTFRMGYLSLSPCCISDSLQKGGLNFKAADCL